MVPPGFEEPLEPFGLGRNVEGSDSTSPKSDFGIFGGFEPGLVRFGGGDPIFNIVWAHRRVPLENCAAWSDELVCRWMAAFGPEPFLFIVLTVVSPVKPAELTVVVGMNLWTVSRGSSSRYLLENRGPCGLLLSPVERHGYYRRSFENFP